MTMHASPLCRGLAFSAALLVVSSAATPAAAVGNRFKLMLAKPAAVAAPAPESCDNDGSAQAPAGTAQYPTLLAEYAYRSPCDVAGADYRVGRASTGLPALKVVGVNTLPTGWSYEPIPNWVRCDSVDGSNLDGWDLTGKAIYVTTTCTNTTIQNNVIAMNGSHTPYCDAISLRGPNTTVQYNTADLGGYAVGSACAAGDVGEGFNFASSATGTQTVKYNHIYNAPQHFVNTGHATVDMRFNLIEKCGFFQGAHCNGFQIQGDSANSRIEYNTFISQQPTDDMGAKTGSFTSGSPAFTSSLGGSNDGHSLYAGAAITGPLIPGGTTILSAATVGSVTTITMSANATGTGSNTFDVTDVYPMGLIIPIRWVSQGSGVMTNGRVVGNTIVTTTPITTVSYAIYCAIENGSNDTVAVNDNYIDIRGAFGAFYPGGGNTLCTNRTGTGNKNMVTGATLSLP